MIKENQFNIQLIFFVLLSKIFISLFFPHVGMESVQIPNISELFWTVDPSRAMELAEIPQNISPLMMYILASLRFLNTLIGTQSILLSSLISSLPIIVADCIILLVLFDFFPNRTREVILFYFLNPIIIFSCFILDSYELLPVSLLLVSINLLLKSRFKKAFICLSFAICLNVNSIFIIPLVIIFLWMHYKKIQLFQLTVILILLYYCFSLPFIVKFGLLDSLIHFLNGSLIFEPYISLGDNRFQYTWFGLCISYALFFRHKKINRDLIFSFFGMAFSFFVLLAPPRPENYVWFLPFLCCFFINYNSPDKNNLYFHTSLCVSYLIYFIFFQSEEIDIMNYIGISLSSSHALDHLDLKGTFFTLLQSIVFINFFVFYKYALKSAEIYSDMRNIIIGIGGDSGSGKSKLLTDLKGMFKNKLLDLEGDGEHKWERGDGNWERFTHLNPKANYIYDQANFIRFLKEGKSIYRKEYDHHTGKFTQLIRVDPRRYVVLCGLHPFYLPKLRKIFDLKIYMDTDENLRKHWKIIRDTQKRGYSKEKILRQIDDRENDSKKYIIPQKKYADFIIRYYSEDVYIPGDTEANPHTKLEVIFDADLQIEKFVEVLEVNGITVEWDYLENLEKQYLIVHDKPPKDSINYFQRYLLDNVINIEELIDVSMDVQWGYRGVIQVLILQIVSLELKIKGNQ